ncbi:diacylglycerol kinase family protein [Christiangramia flava]|uniref:Diacylglycerol kinase n=1 Tax=Christiangramia flava JLT2011 TaxID=1229726 RepID=A0A1L7I041_9FLAO|nr:diacylglycerol kinase family protein [Christiangramia flava]APU66958.1 Diacylglycerol kinase [Christiangramia flava JLT2011]OSS38630.1 Diacylglycerol kinase [Christiangramia flava JLT2011]
MKNSFLGKRIRGGGYAMKGAWLLLRHEPSIQVQFVISILVCIAGFYFDISRTEWIFQFFAIGMVMSAEGLNTAVEAIADFVHPDFHTKIGHIKDVAAGAVFIAAIIAVIIAVLIYYPYLS